jgi:hypothetical protein
MKCITELEVYSMSFDRLSCSFLSNMPMKNMMKTDTAESRYAD